MKKIILFIIMIIFLGAIFSYVNSQEKLFTLNTPQTERNQTNRSVNSNITLTTVIAENLDTPWAIAFLPDGSMLVTERPGRVRFVDNQGQLDAQPAAVLDQVDEIGEGGLLGITLHPDFAKAASGKPNSSSSKFVYLYYTYSGSGENTLNRVVRMTYQDKQLINEQVIVDRIPGASNHNGGRIKFGPDGYLYITTGDAQNPSQAQDRNSLAGKILRVTDDGKSVQDNPFNNLVYSYGHRNPQGLTWNSKDQLWTTEHGRSGALSGLDEINLIEKGKNYGWPEIQGDEIKEGMERPTRNSGSTTWAPAGAAFINNTLFFAGLCGETLYEAVIENNQVVNLNEHFKGEFERLREVILGPDGMLYITTSNRDGRGDVQSNDDKIIRINPNLL